MEGCDKQPREKYTSCIVFFSRVFITNILSSKSHSYEWLFNLTLEVKNLNNLDITLKHGDCLELMKDIQNKSIDMILCDLPYGTTSCKWDNVIPLENLWKQYKRIIKDNGAIVLFSSQPFTTNLIHSNKQYYRYNWYWIKNTTTGFSYARYQPMRKVEDICVFYKKRCSYFPQGLKKLEKPKIKSRNDLNGINGYSLNKIHKSEYTNYPNHVLYFDKEYGLHPTQKPIALLEYLIKTYTNEGEIVLDNCMGSGSTGVACVNTNRNFMGIELDENFFKIAEERINNTLNECIF